jgi:hypothetical protein
MPGRQWTPEQRAEHSRKMRDYFATHEHPRRGAPVGDETRQRMRESAARRVQQRPQAYCKTCDEPLYSARSIRRGYGVSCWTKAIENGDVTVDEWGQPIRKPEDSTG